ncbi:hypothetical protein B7494_g2755 [Chlorociboria aeruginascens]|nr:hypothetical protein B7494_g2755 [Chlorociboria aeruginascens]
MISLDARRWSGLLREEREAHLQRRTQRLPVIFVIGTLARAVCCSELTITGDTETPQLCSFLYTRFGFQHISVREVLREMSHDENFLHAEVLRDCLDEGIDVPVYLVTSLLERRIRDAKGECVLVSGILDCMKLVDFERQCSGNGTDLADAFESDGVSQAWKIETIVIDEYLKSTGEYVKERSTT